MKDVLSHEFWTPSGFVYKDNLHHKIYWIILIQPILQFSGTFQEHMFSLSNDRSYAFSKHFIK